MSGIAGIIHFDGAPVEPGQIEQMTSAMACRGPDGIKHWTKGSVALGQCMLRTTPESLEETQPLRNEDESLVLVMDGRMDNWEELRRELLGRGAVLRTRADAELVLRAYEVWGKDCLAHMDGDFALAIWDARRQQAFCARDRMGNKPFQYHWNGRTLVFASELHPILALPWVQEMPNKGMLAEFLSDEWYSRDETLWTGIMRLVAAHSMEVDSRGPQPKSYWEPDLWATLPYTKDEEYIEHYRDLLFDTVRRLSRSHRPVAIEVSGGLDSSAVFCVAEHLRGAKKLPSPGIEGYTLAFTDDVKANELQYARLVSQELGIPIHEIVPAHMPLSWYAVRAKTLRDFPGYPNGTMHRAITEAVSSAKGVVVLTGSWGDHWLQGSRMYYAEELAQRHWLNLLNCFSSDVKAFGTKQATYWFLRHGVYPMLPSELKAVLGSLLNRMRTKQIRNASWLSPKMEEILAMRRTKPQPQDGLRCRTKGQFELLKTLHYAFDHYGAEIGERQGADAGIEIRHPFRTSKFVQYAFSTPEHLRLRGNLPKFIHVQAMQGVLPSAILERRSKADFAGVFVKYLDQISPVFTDELSRKRADWCHSEGISDLFHLYQKQPELGWPTWVLWNIYGCDMVFPP